jgi:hypothetical protein
LVHCFAILSCRLSSNWFWSIEFSWSYDLWTQKNITNNQFSASFLSPLADIYLIFGTLLFHSKLQIKFEFGFDPYIFPKLKPMNLEKILRIITFPHLFFSLLTYIHLIFGRLLCHTKFQIKFKFGFDPLDFHEVMAHWRRKVIRIVSVFALL